MMTRGSTVDRGIKVGAVWSGGGKGRGCQGHAVSDKTREQGVDNSQTGEGFWGRRGSVRGLFGKGFESGGEASGL